MVVFCGLIFSMFAISIMQIILASALPSIVGEIGGAELYGWVFTSYMLAAIFVIPLFSKLADIYGKIKFYILGVCIFIIGSFIGSFSNSMEILIISRIIQGIGAGIITPVAMAIVSDVFSDEKRGRMIGVFGIVQLVSNLISPPLGSFLTTNFGWQWIFYINIILISIGGFLVLIRRPKEVTNLEENSIDILGGITFGVFCVITVFLSNLLSQSKFDSLSIFILLLDMIVLIMLIKFEKRHENPIIKISFFKNKILRRAIVNGLISGAVMYGMVNVLPLYDISKNILLMIFMICLTLGMLISSLFSNSRIIIYIPKMFWGISFIIFIILAIVVDYKYNILIYSLIGITGFCIGGIMSTLLISSQKESSEKDRAILSGFVQLARYFGASLGVIILTASLYNNTSISFIGVFIILSICSLFGFINEKI